MLKLAKAAGLTKSEMHDHPEHGLMISLSGIHKLAAMAPDATIARKVCIVVPPE
jgi:hypothetical protein